MSDKIRVIYKKNGPPLFDSIVLSPNGEDISRCVRSITWHHDAGKIPIVTLEVFGDIFAEEYANEWPGDELCRNDKTPLQQDIP